MAMSVTYVTVHGRLREETRGGVTTRYLGDTLGSVIKTTDTSGNVTSTTTYWPCGEVRTQTGTNPSPWGFCGVWGYLTDAVSRMYVRARHYRADVSRWLTVDPLWPKEEAYIYKESLPLNFADPTGLGGNVANTTPVFPDGRNYGCGETPCCEFNTRYWKEQCRATGNKFTCCASRVSRFICDSVNTFRRLCQVCSALDAVLIGPVPRLTACALADAFDCQNSCMRYNHQIGLDPLWRRARSICARFGESSYQCCEASFRAEQSEYNTCAGRCFPAGLPLALLPYPWRIDFGLKVLECCGTK